MKQRNDRMGEGEKERSEFFSPKYIAQNIGSDGKIKF